MCLRPTQKDTRRKNIKFGVTDTKIKGFDVSNFAKLMDSKKYLPLTELGNRMAWHRYGQGHTTRLLKLQYSWGSGAL